MKSNSRVSNRQLLLIGSLTLLSAASLHGIVVVSDQSFSLSDASQASVAMQLGGIETEFSLWDELSSGLPPHSGAWKIKQFTHHPQVYYEVAIGEFPWAENLSYGALIDSSLNWQDLNSPRAGITLVDYIREEGGFFNTEGFLGIRMFSMDSLDAYHGWIRMEHNVDQATFTVHDWAWNGTAGAPIHAGEIPGQIPEPRTIALLMGAIAFLATLRYKRLRSSR